LGCSGERNKPVDATNIGFDKFGLNHLLPAVLQEASYFKPSSAATRRGKLYQRACPAATQFPPLLEGKKYA
jgi:hypothetical protein